MSCATEQKLLERERLRRTISPALLLSFGEFTTKSRAGAPGSVRTHSTRSTTNISICSVAGTNFSPSSPRRLPQTLISLGSQILYEICAAVTHCSAFLFSR
jgi:hypothetical protein